MKCRNLIIYLLLASLFVLLHAPVFEWWCGTWMGQLLGQVTPSGINDIMALAVAVFGSVLALVTPQRLSTTGNKWGRVLLGGFLYVLVVQSVAFNECFIHFKSLSWFRYTDIFILPCVFFWIRSCLDNKKPSNRCPKPCETSSNLYYDDTEETDFLGRESLVNHICQQLTEENGNNNGAAGVAVTGGWGTGKSWMMYQIKHRLEDKGEICIDFKPWLYGEVDMTRQFYLVLEQQLKLHGLKMEELNRAIAEIDNDKMVGFGSAFLSLFGIVIKGAGREKAVEHIKEKLKKENRRFFVFIDDCDRLARKELMQVLSLIRNTGDLPGVTYLMAFDKQAVEKIVGEETGLNYVGKMFNLTIELPPTTDEVMASYLHQAACRLMGENMDEDNPFLNIPITNFLPTIREAKKYLNLLLSDYKKLKSRFDKYHVYASDFCLLEIIKYKYSGFYYSLQSTPDVYLKTENTAGWNCPAYIPDNEENAFSQDLFALIKALFKIIKNFKEPVEIIGIANKDYFPLYFEKDLERQFVDGKEFNKAVEDKRLPQKIGEWINAGYQGVFSLLCAVHRGMSSRDVFLSMAIYIWQQCEGNSPINDLGQLTYGYRKEDLKHGFKGVMNVVERIPQMEMLTMQLLAIMDDPDEEDDGMSKLVQESEYTMELMGIMLNQLKHIPDGDNPFDEVKYYIEMLWKRVVEKVHEGIIGTTDVMDMLDSCTLEDTFKQMALPLIMENPQRWLGATVSLLKDGDKEYYLPKSRWVRAIFGSYGKMEDELKEIERSVKKENQEYVKAYWNLLFGVAAMTINKDDSSIPVFFQRPACIATDRLSALATSELLGMGPLMPIEAAIERMGNTPFWKGKDFRIHREALHYYFHTDL